jgi:hypothetical protein
MTDRALWLARFRYSQTCGRVEPGEVRIDPCMIFAAKNWGEASLRRLAKVTFLAREPSVLRVGDRGRPK